MKILYLAHRIPYPPNKGDKIRSFNEIRYLSQKHEIDLACLADEYEDIKYLNNLKNYCRNVNIEFLDKKYAKIRAFFSLLKNRSFSSGYFYLKKLQNTIETWLSENSYDAVICFCSPMAEYIFRSKFLKKSTHPLLIIDFCDLDSDKWSRYSKSASFPLSLIYKTEGRLLFEFEKKINKFFDWSVFVSENEADLFKKKYPEALNVEDVPNGVDYKYFASDQNLNNFYPPGKEDAPVIIFTGVMDYYANINGVQWFASEVFPLIKRKYPDARFYIVGSSPSKEVRDLEKTKGIFVTGYVEDIKPYYQHADVSVVPLKIARGIQNKVLEAMAMSKPVVATSEALKGINPPDQAALSADSAEDFAEKISNILKDSMLKNNLGNEACTFIRKNFSWDKSGEKLETLLVKSYPEKQN